MNTMKEVFPNNTFFHGCHPFPISFTRPCVHNCQKNATCYLPPPLPTLTEKTKGSTYINQREDPYHRASHFWRLIPLRGYAFLLMTSIEANKLVLYGSSFGCSGQSVIRRPSGSVLQ